MVLRNRFWKDCDAVDREKNPRSTLDINIFHPFPTGDFSRCQPIGFTGFLFYTNRRWRGVIFIRGKVGDVFPGERVRGLEARRVWQGFCVTMCVIGGWWVDEVMPGNDFKQLVFGDACFSCFLKIMSPSWRCFNLKPTTLVMRDVAALHGFFLFWLVPN